MIIYAHVLCVHRDMFCAGRVPDEDLRRTMHACGGAIQTTVSGMPASALGECELFEERQIGGDRYNSVSFKLTVTVTELGNN